MKKKVLSALTVCFFAGAVMLSGLFMQQEANATTPDCPNGCLNKCGSCVCGEWYPYEEATHQLQQLQ